MQELFCVCSGGNDTAISLAEKIVDTEIENVYSTPKQQNISHSYNEKFR